MRLVMEGVEYLSAAVVAEDLSTTQLNVLMLLRHKALEGELIEGTWYVTAESVAKYRTGDTAAKRRNEGCSTSCIANGCNCS